jgi:imidazolonepropionase-like amidohydrolase
VSNFLRPLIITLWLGVFWVGSVLGAQNSSTVAIVGAHLVRLDGSGVLRDSVVLIENERISAIGTASDVVIPAGARKIQLDDAWLAPGLMNMHVHWGLILPGREAARLADETNAALALRMAKNARDSLLSGTTTVRMPGDRRHADLALLRAIERGDAVGPRLISAGQMVPITHGHGAKGRAGYDGPYELMKGVRKEIHAGATWIKIAISGGIATDGGGIAEALMTPEEIHAVIDAAHRFGAKVTAHSGSPSATSIAVKAGINSIEHGYHLTREVLREMKNAGTWYVPTIVVSQPATLPFFVKIGSPEWYLKRRDSTGKNHWKALEMAIEEGVDIALGTDQLPHEPNDGTVATVREAEYYVSAGMSSLQALRSATIEPAKMLGLDSDIGSLEVGKFADIIAVSGNPLEDIKSLRTIFFVMKGGAIVRNDLVDPL